ncbi:radical SAM protein [Mesorhizobium sp. B2-4-13]|uniref:radical SAM protein n=1 Tax=Mesorhizobium sp. B2-4-13 TaxID=2589936 RepID=UPI0015EEBA8C|nr:radical SAM protein [Mesorhizobium sp. B2-4-13]
MTVTHSRYNQVHVNEWNFLEHFGALHALLVARREGNTNNLLKIAPVTVEIDPVDYCNHACEWCFTASHRESDRMSDDSVRTLVAQLGKMGAKSVHFAGGGEPTLLKHFARLKGRKERGGTEKDQNTVLDAAEEANLTAGVISNGSTLRALDLDRLVGQLSWIRFSIDAGTEERYRKKHRPKGHTLLDLHSGIEALVQSRGASPYPTIGASFIFEVVSPEIIDEIKLFARNMARLKVDYIQIKPENLNRGPDVEALLDSLGPILAEELTGSSTFAAINQAHPNTDDARYCWYSHIGPVVGATGDVYACCYTYGMPDFKLGNMLDEERGFAGVWNSEKRLAVTSGIDPALCLSCRHASFNRIADRLYELDKEDWDWLADALSEIKKGKQAREIVPRPRTHWVVPGLEQYELLQRSARNTITDYPVYRETQFISAKQGV